MLSQCYKVKFQFNDGPSLESWPRGFKGVLGNMAMSMTPVRSTIREDAHKFFFFLDLSGSYFFLAIFPLMKKKVVFCLMVVRGVLPPPS